MDNIVDKNLQDEFGLTKNRITYLQRRKFIIAKKLIVIIVVAIMLFEVFGIAGCTESLKEYKGTAKAAIQTYALEKNLNNEYSAKIGRL